MTLIHLSLQIKHTSVCCVCTDSAIHLAGPFSKAGEFNITRHAIEQAAFKRKQLNLDRLIAF